MLQKHRTPILEISQVPHNRLRKLLIHGARAVLPTLSKSEMPLGAWLRALLARVHKNAAVVALANKLARIAWAVLRRKRAQALEIGHQRAWCEDRLALFELIGLFTCSNIGVRNVST